MPSEYKIEVLRIYPTKPGRCVFVNNSQVGPYFEDPVKAQTFAMYISRGLRQTDVPQVPAVTLGGAQPLYDAIQEEIELCLEAEADDPTPEGVGDWLGHAYSISLSKTGEMTLDYDQAVLVADLLGTIIETLEELDESWGSDLPYMREAASHLQALGFPITGEEITNAIAD